MTEKESYQGFETGPIRPPSEAGSLMLRITRNCPWNQCKFCGLYKGEKFSKRPMAHVKQDIDLIRASMDQIQAAMNPDGDIDVPRLAAGTTRKDQAAFHAALNWHQGKMESVFLQDANTLIIKPDDLVEILDYLRKQFPRIQRITSYARSHTIARISDADMARLAEAGLDRIHIGMESAADEVLDFVKKGVDKITHIKAGQRVKRANIELSEYFMPGLGGAAHSHANALETADAMNQINPDFIRIRTLAVTDFSDLAKDARKGQFTPLNDRDTAKELLMFLEKLEGITSAIKSDHILNLFQEVDGVLPKDRDAMTYPIQKFLAMPPEQQMLYRIGRRANIFSKLEDLNNQTLLAHVEKIQTNYGVTVDNIDEFTNTIMKQFI
jgi:hypothetical protein